MKALGFSKLKMISVIKHEESGIWNECSGKDDIENDLQYMHIEEGRSETIPGNCQENELETPNQGTNT